MSPAGTWVFMVENQVTINFWLTLNIDASKVYVDHYRTNKRSMYLSSSLTLALSRAYLRKSVSTRDKRYSSGAEQSAAMAHLFSFSLLFTEDDARVVLKTRQTNNVQGFSGTEANWIFDNANLISSLVTSSSRAGRCSRSNKYNSVSIIFYS